MSHLTRLGAIFGSRRYAQDILERGPHHVFTQPWWWDYDRMRHVDQDGESMRASQAKEQSDQDPFAETGK